MKSNPIEKLDQLVWDKYRGKPVKNISIDYPVNEGDLTVLRINLLKKSISVHWYEVVDEYVLQCDWRKRAEDFTTYTAVKKRVFELLDRELKS